MPPLFRKNPLSIRTAISHDAPAPIIFRKYAPLSPEVIAEKAKKALSMKK